MEKSVRSFMFKVQRLHAISASHNLSE